MMLIFAQYFLRRFHFYAFRRRSLLPLILIAAAVADAADIICCAIIDYIAASPLFHCRHFAMPFMLFFIAIFDIRR